MAYTNIILAIIEPRFDHISPIPISYNLKSFNVRIYWAVILTFVSYKLKGCAVFIMRIIRVFQVFFHNKEFLGDHVLLGDTIVVDFVWIINYCFTNNDERKYKIGNDI
jgi:hypothetical protein